MARSVKQVQKMIGFMNYFKNYIPRLTEKLLPFYRVLQKGEKVTVTTEQKQMLQILKEDLKLAMERTMRLPLAGKQYVIMSDASDFAAGYVLLIEDYTQEQGRNKKTYAPVAFGSQKFSPGQYKHTIHTKEFLAIYFAFENFAHMLWGITHKPLVVFTDNKALSAFLQSPTIPASLCKYVDRLLQFKFVLAHVAGENNPAADYLNRMYLNPHLTMELEIGATIPVHEVQVRLKPQIQTETPIPNEDGSPPTPSPPQSPKPSCEDEDDEMINLIATLQHKIYKSGHIVATLHKMEEIIPYEANALQHPDPTTIENIATKQDRYNMQKEQDKDLNIQKVKFWITHKVIPEVKYENFELQQYARQLSRLYLTDEGLLFRKFYAHDGKSYDNQLIIPKHLRDETLAFLHNAKTEAHRGSRKTIEQCRKQYYWPFYNNDIEDWIKKCLVCAQISPVKSKYIRPPLQEITSKTSFPGDMMQIDLVGPFAPSNGFTQVMTAIDVFTKYLFAAPLRRVTSQTVTHVLTQIFLKHTYIPKILLTDEGSQFTSKLMKDVNNTPRRRTRTRNSETPTDHRITRKSTCRTQKDPQDLRKHTPFRLAQILRLRSLRPQHELRPTNENNSVRPLPRFCTQQGVGSTLSSSAQKRTRISNNATNSRPFTRTP